MKKPRALPTKLESLATDFIAQYPVLDQPPHTRLTSGDLDDFGIAQGAYPATIDTTSDPEMNAARGTLVQRLNLAGSAPAWVSAANPGFELVVITVDEKRSSVWEVKPLPVSVSHRTLALPDRNIKTITNRALRIDRMYQGINQKSLTSEEKKLTKTEQEVNLRLAQMLTDGARAQKLVLDRGQKRMERKDPTNRLLPK